MLYTEMNINQKINFKSWRVSKGRKLFRNDYFPRPDELWFWAGQSAVCGEPLIPDLDRNINQKIRRRHHE